MDKPSLANSFFEQISAMSPADAFNFLQGLLRHLRRLPHHASRVVIQLNRQRAQAREFTASRSAFPAIVSNCHWSMKWRSDAPRKEVLRLFRFRIQSARVPEIRRQVKSR
jgi:hypothetical protein